MASPKRDESEGRVCQGGRVRPRKCLRDTGGPVSLTLAHVRARLAAGTPPCVPMCVGCPPLKALPAGGVLARHLGCGAHHEDAQTGDDHAGGHGPDEDLEGHHHPLRLRAGSCLVARKPGETASPRLQLRSHWTWQEGSPILHPHTALNLGIVPWPDQLNHGGRESWASQGAPMELRTLPSSHPTRCLCL